MNPHPSNKPKVPSFEDDIKRSGLIDVAESLNIKVKTKADNFLDQFITVDKSMIELKSRVKKLSRVDIPVLITGETGVGKELIANALHGERIGHFVAVNCGGIPSELLESEFFGCVKGAFTGAFHDRDGYFDEAKDGTLFLDEIGEMPMLLQCKLLRVLQEMKIRKIGSSKEHKVNCRIVSATNRNGSWLKSSGMFRRDLFYRLAPIILNITPLRERVDDIKEICRMKNFQWDGHEPFYSDYRWDGNVRELLNLINEKTTLT